MSHVTACKTKIADLDVFQSAVTKLGLTLERGQGLTVTDYDKKSVAVEARIKLGQYDLGLRRNAEGALEFVSDFWGIKNYCDIPKIKEAIRRTGSAETGLANLFGKAYDIAVAEKTIKEQYADCEAVYEYDSTGEVVRIALVRRSY